MRMTLGCRVATEFIATCASNTGAIGRFYINILMDEIGFEVVA